MGDALSAKVRSRIYFFGSGWKIAESSDPIENVRDVEVLLEIQGDTKDGYHLVMSPAGGFTADYWYASKQEALTSAFALFGVSSDERSWTTQAR